MATPVREASRVRSLVRVAFFATFTIAAGACWLTASLDARTDAGDGRPPLVDAATDAPGDARREASPDSPRDAPVDAGRDAGQADGGGPVDGAMDGTPNDTSGGAVDCVSATSYAESVIAAHPIAYWRLGETDSGGGVAVDSVGTHNGTYTPGVAFGFSGPFEGSTAVTLNGSGGEVRVTSDGGFAAFLGTQSYTVEAWVRPAAITGQFLGIVSNERVTDAGKQGYALYLQVEAGVGFDRYQLPVSTPLTLPDAASPNAWSYVVGSYESGEGTDAGPTVRLYVNGRAPVEAKTSLSIVGDCTFVIGATHCGNSGYFQGRVAELAVYDYAIDPRCVTAHYAFSHP